MDVGGFGFLLANFIFGQKMFSILGTDQILIYRVGLISVFLHLI